VTFQLQFWGLVACIAFAAGVGYWAGFRNGVEAALEEDA
jgi:hypothetical protein